MRINHNVSALNAYRQLTINNSSMQKSLEKLSSGYRINRAGDDAAGLAISEKMRAQIRGLDMATRNAQDGISMIQTAEGALNETHSILQRMRELAVQAANDTATDADRSEIQKEIEQLKSEIDRIANQTEFNTKKLLDGSLQVKGTLSNNNAKLTSIAAGNDVQTGTYTVTIANSSVAAVNFEDKGTGVAVGNLTIGTDVKSRSYKVEITNVSGTAATATLYDAKTGEKLGSATNADVSTNPLTVGGITIAAGSISSAGSFTFDVQVTADVQIQDASSTDIVNKTGLTTTNGTIEVDGWKIGVDSNITSAASTATITNKAISFHIGANQDQTTKLDISEMSTTALNIDGIDVRTQSGAEAAITAVNTAIETVSAERSKLGAIQNRLEHTINNLGTASENLTASESRIRDVDMAKEMMEFTKQNILNQAATAMLAQANTLPQSVLKLLS